MPTSSFRVALQGKMIRGRVDFSAEAGPANIVIGGGMGGLARGDYSLIGLLLGRQRDIVTIATAADNDDYTIVVKGRPFTFDSGAGATVTTIRNGLLALLTAPIQAALGIVAAASGADAINIDAIEPGGEALDTAVTADVPANITLTYSALGPADAILAVAKRSGQFEARSTAAITAGQEFAVVG